MNSFCGAMFCALLLLAGCTQVAEQVSLPATLEVPKQPALRDDESTAAAQAEDLQQQDATKDARTPRLPMRTEGYTTGTGAWEPELSGEPIALNVESMPLPAFINEVFGNLLGLGFSIDPGLSKKRDLVTLRLSEPQAPLELYRIAVQVLQDYGVTASERNGILSFETAAPGQTSDTPLLISGRALPDVPGSHRPVFHLVQLRAVFANDAARWLQSAYGSYGLKIEPDLKRNALMLSGKQSVVRDAYEALQILDRPFMRGQNGLRISPAFVKANDLAKQLIDVLAAEGYSASDQLHTGGGAIVVLPIESANMVLLFAADAALLKHAQEWAHELDVPPRGSGQSLFIYSVKNTKAKSIADTVNSLLGSVSRAPQDQSSEPGTAATSTPGRIAGGRIVVDEPRNALLFKGEAARWQELSQIIHILDTPPKQVLVEVTVAEVTLSGQESFGVQWFEEIGGDNIEFLPVSDGVAGLGITYTVLDGAGVTKAVLNAFAADSKVNILSTPRILVQSGDSARIDIGTDVPIITSQSQGDTDDARITQNVQYRKTGLILEVTPVVHSGDRVDMEIDQEISEALPLGEDASINSPSIFTRIVQTALSLSDGGSVLFAGFITNRETKSDSGVPFLKDLPLLGAAFRSETLTSDKTELVIMISPYVIEDAQESEAITETILDTFELID